MANRLAVAGDITTYTSWIDANIPGGQSGPRGMQVNDIIIDTYTNVPTKGIFYNSGNPFGGARAGATIWLLSDTFNNDASYFYFANLGVVLFTTTPSNPCHVRPLNGQVKFVRNNSETSNLIFEIADLEYVVIDGEINSHPGLRGEWGTYKSGTFGFWLTDSEHDPNVRGCVITGPSLKGAAMYGVEVNDCFSAFRVARSNDTQNLDWFYHKRCMAAFGVAGEGGYIGQTVDNAANPVFKKVEVESVIYAYRGTEAWQMQNLASNSGSGYIKNFVAFGAALKWKNAFQPNQDSGLQVQVQNGDIVMKDFVLQGWAEIGLQIFSQDLSARGYTAGTEPFFIRNAVLGGGRQKMIRVHGSYDNGPTLDIRDIDLLDVSDNYNEISTYSNADHWVASAHTSGKYQHWTNIKYKSRKAEFFANDVNDNSWGQRYSVNISADDTVPDPDFVNNGWDGVDIEKLEIWSDTAARDSGAQITYNAGDYVINIVTDGEYKFYKCLITHTAAVGTTNRPDNDATNWVQITWDESGVRSDDAGWSSGDTQSDLPPTDFRLVRDSYHSLLGRGLRHNQQPSTRTNYKWEWAETNSPDPADIFVIGDANGHTLDTNNYHYLSSGMYVRLTVTPPGSSSSISNWLQLT